MFYQINFDKRYHYDTTKKGISLETVIKNGDSIFTCWAQVDTGAEVCLFSGDIAAQLNIDVESGERIVLGTLTGGLVAYGHEVTLEVLEISLATFVYFTETPLLPRNLLGRQGWLQLVKLGLIDYDNEIYLSAYNEEI